VGRKCLGVCLKQIRTRSRAAGVGVLDDGDRRLGELLRQVPAGVQINQVVVAQLLPLKLLRSCDSGGAAIAVERGSLVRVLAVTQRGNERITDAQWIGEGGLVDSR